MDRLQPPHSVLDDGVKVATDDYRSAMLLSLYLTGHSSNEDWTPIGRLFPADPIPISMVLQLTAALIANHLSVPLESSSEFSSQSTSEFQRGT